MSTSGRYLLDRGVGALAGSFYPLLPRYSSTLSTAALTYWVDPNAQHFMLLAIVTWRRFPPRYCDGGPIDSSLSFKCFPISSLRISYGLCEITRQSSTLRSTYSKYSSPSGLVADLLHTSGSAWHEVNPRWSMQSRKWCQKSLTATFPPYKARVIRATLPTFSKPNSAPQTIKSFSDDSALR